MEIAKTIAVVIGTIIILIVVIYGIFVGAAIAGQTYTYFFPRSRKFLIDDKEWKVVVKWHPETPDQDTPRLYIDDLFIEWLCGDGIDTIFKHPFDENLVIAREEGPYGSMMYTGRDKISGKINVIYFIVLGRFCINKNYRSSFLMNLEENKFKLYLIPYDPGFVTDVTEPFQINNIEDIPSQFLVKYPDLFSSLHFH